MNLWIKCNTYGASNNTTSSCGGTFRNSNAEFLCENKFLGSVWFGVFGGEGGEVIF
jgi:hypothetical protein